MSKYFGLMSLEIQKAIQAFGVNPKDVRSVELRINAGEVPAVTFTLYPDHRLVAALLKAARTVPTDVTFNQDGASVTIEPTESTPEGSPWERCDAIAPSERVVAGTRCEQMLYHGSEIHGNANHGAQVGGMWFEW